MPALVALYDGKKGVKLIDFGKVRRNYLRWSPFGRFFLSAGFGVLVGDCDVWDKSKTLALCRQRLECVVNCDFAPDGRTLLASTTAPRMRVDNCVQLIRYSKPI